MRRAKALNGLAVRLRILRYLLRGRRPWSVGYQEYKERVLRSVVAQRRVLDWFSAQGRLSPGYGVALDERVVEYPWLLTRLGRGPGRLLDAGASLNHEWILRHPILAARRITICTLTPEPMISRPRVDHVYADLRATPFAAGMFGEIACISTLEHVGMDNTFVYGARASFNEADPQAYLKAVGEFKRLLTPGGRLFITVPFGRRQHFGWQQQFDGAELNAIVQTFDGSNLHVAFFRYEARGWQRASETECADCEYYDVRRSLHHDDDRAAAARAVACIELTR